MADVAASPEKLVVEGGMVLIDDYEYRGVEVSGEDLQLNIDDWAGAGHSGCPTETVYPGTYRITVERLTSDG